MFSKADYELASRILGLPMPTTPAEMAAATPATAAIVRRFATALPPMPGHEADQGMYTGATHSLNGYPDNNNPMQRTQLEQRMRVTDDNPNDEYLLSLIAQLEPQEFALVVQLLQQLAAQQDEHMDMLSAQRPAQYDTPNLGANYSMLNAPASNNIAPSENFQYLS